MSYATIRVGSSAARHSRSLIMNSVRTTSLVITVQNCVPHIPRARSNSDGSELRSLLISSRLQ